LQTEARKKAREKKLLLLRHEKIKTELQQLNARNSWMFSPKGSKQRVKEKLLKIVCLGLRVNINDRKEH